MVYRALVLIVVLAAGACTFTGPKGGKPGWKIYKDERERPVPAVPMRVGPIELRLTRVFLRREHTVIKTVNWTAWIRATVVSSGPLPASAFDGAFTILGRSGTVYRPHVMPVIRRTTWQQPAQPGEPSYLPPGVPGELDIWISFDGGGDRVPDELAALTFHDLQLGL